MTTKRLVPAFIALFLGLLAIGCVETPVPDDGDGDGDGGGNLPAGTSTQVDPVLEATAGASAVALGDFNRDGSMDFVSVSSENQPVQLHLKNAGTGKFDLLSIAGGGPLAIMIDVATADFNGDGKLDIAVLANDSGFAPPPSIDKLSALVVLIQGADPLDFSDWTHVEPLDICYADATQPGCNFLFLENETGAVDMTVADFTNDGYPDVAVTSNEPGSPPITYVYVLINPGPSDVTDPTQWGRVVADFDANDFMQVEAVDLDEDGDNDIVAAAPTSITYNLRWLRNEGAGLFWGFGEVGEQTGGANCFAVGDINGDGHLDVAAARSDMTFVQWFQNPGPAALSPFVPLVPWYVYNVGFVNQIDAGQTPASSVNHMYLQDMDLDGQLEIFLTADGITYQYERSANGVTHPWTGSAMFATSPAGEIGWVAFYDFEGTSLPDVLFPVDRDGLTQDGFFLFSR